MNCPQCGLTNPPNVIICAKCQTPLPVRRSGVSPSLTGVPHLEEADQTIIKGVATGGPGGSAAGAREARISAGVLRKGSVLGDRYEILKQLGGGGMGTV